MVEGWLVSGGWNRHTVRQVDGLIRGWMVRRQANGWRQKKGRMDRQTNGRVDRYTERKYMDRLVNGD